MRNHIPKTIHYVWGYNEPKSFLARACIASWKYHMPEYTVKEWNENTLDFDELSSESRFFRECYRRKLWAYVADYIRVKVLYEHGGIYLDTDMQLFKSLDPFLKHQFFAGFHDGYSPEGKNSTAYVEGALMGAEPNHPLMHKMISFFQDKMHKSSLLYFPHILTPILHQDYGLKSDNEYVELKEGVAVYPIVYFFPLRSQTQELEKLDTRHYSIHWFQNSYASRPFSRLYLLGRDKKGFKKFFFMVRRMLLILCSRLFRF